MATFLLLLLHGCVLKSAIARLDLTVTSSACGTSYDMEDILEEAYVVYNGAWLIDKECTVEFINYHVYSKQICIKLMYINFKMGCATEVEYHRGFVSKHLAPEKLLTCRRASYDEWCGPMKTIRFNLLFRTFGRKSDDNIEVHVYLKYYPKDDTGDDDDDDGWVPNSNRTRFGIIFPVACGVVVFIVIIIVLCVIVFKKRQTRRMPRTPNMYHTSGRQLNIQTGNVSQAQPMIGYHSSQQAQFHPNIQGSYQLHPMQSAYPDPAQQGYSPVAGYQPVSQREYGHQSPIDFQGRYPDPSAPTEPNADPPPSYESVAK